MCFAVRFLSFSIQNDILLIFLDEIVESTTRVSGGNGHPVLKSFDGVQSKRPQNIKSIFSDVSGQVL